MSMVCGLDLHRGQVTFDAVDVTSGEVWRGRDLAAGPAAVPALAPRRARPAERTGSRWRSRWRVAPGGAMWPRRSAPPGSTRTWPNRPIPRRRGDANGAPRPTGPTPGCCGSCSPVASCPSHGSHPPWCWSGGSVSGSTRRCWTSAPSGPSGSTPSCSNTVWVSPRDAIASAPTRQRLAEPGLAISPAGRERIDAGYAMIDATNAQLEPLRAELVRFGTRQPACRALVAAHYGIGGLTAVAIWAELGDCQRFSGRCRLCDTPASTSPSTPRTVTAPEDTSPPRPRDAALGALRGGQELGAGRAPTTPTTARSSNVTAARSPPSRWPASSPSAATTRSATSTPTRSTPSLSRPIARHTASQGPAHHRRQGPAVDSSFHSHARRRPRPDGLKTTSRPRPHTTGVTQSRSLSPTTQDRRAPRKR